MKTVDLGELARWSYVPEGRTVRFSRPQVRTVRIETNSEIEASISLIREDGQVQFLASVLGPTLVEFAEGGTFDIVATAPIYLYSSEFEQVSFEVLDPVIFTKIAERRKRNPELEYITEVMTRNMERRFAQLDVERDRNAAYTRQLEAELARKAATQPDTAVSGTDDGDGQPGPDAGTASS